MQPSLTTKLRPILVKNSPVLIATALYLVIFTTHI